MSRLDLVIPPNCAYECYNYELPTSMVSLISNIAQAAVSGDV
jgi:hypothetical protein